jgi:hypothetical protein
VTRVIGQIESFSRAGMGERILVALCRVASSSEVAFASKEAHCELRESAGRRNPFKSAVLELEG